MRWPAETLAVLLLVGFSADGFSAAPGPVRSDAGVTNRDAASGTNTVDFVAKGNQAYKSGNPSNAVEFFTQAIAANPTNLIAYYNRGRIRDVQGDKAGALADFDRLLSFAPEHMGTRQLRGQLHLRQGRWAQAIADFDAYIKLAPKAEARHWQRGIAYYLAGRYPDGVRQFGLCSKANTNDLENVLWQFACLAKAGGVEKAKGALQAKGTDPRAIVRELFHFYDGKLALAGLLATPLPQVKDGDPTSQEEQNFLCFYYLWLYFDATGDAKQAAEYLAKAAAIKSPNKLMLDVAKAQLSSLAKPADTPAVQ
jgi:tetratricopeptide (TPR) repeat protein